jgi:hypothetical protein
MQGGTIWVVDANRDGKRFIVRPDNKLTAFLELQKEDTRVRDQFDMTRKQLA